METTRDCGNRRFEAQKNAFTEGGPNESGACTYTVSVYTQKGKKCFLVICTWGIHLTFGLYLSLENYDWFPKVMELYSWTKCIYSHSAQEMISIAKTTSALAEHFFHVFSDFFLWKTWDVPRNSLKLRPLEMPLFFFAGSTPPPRWYKSYKWRNTCSDLISIKYMTRFSMIVGLVPL